MCCSFRTIRENKIKSPGFLFFFLLLFCSMQMMHNNNGASEWVFLHLPVAISVWCTSTAEAKTYSASGNRTSSARASQTPSMCGSCVESTRTLARSWTRRHSPDSVVTGWRLQSALDARTTDDSWGSWWRQCRWCLSSSTSPLVRRCRDQGTREPAKRNKTLVCRTSTEASKLGSKKKVQEAQFYMPKLFHFFSIFISIWRLIGPKVYWTLMEPAQFPIRCFYFVTKFPSTLFEARFEECS